MSRFLDVTYSEKGTVSGLIERTFIVAILLLSFEPEGSGSNFRLKHTFKRGNLALTKLENMMFVNDEGW